MAKGPVKRTPVIDLCDDDGPKYRGGSSDEDVGQARIPDIKPATFTKASRNPDREKVMESPVATGSVGNRFKDIVGSAFYIPPESGPSGRSFKRQGDEGMSAMGSGDRSAKRSRID